MDGGPGRQLASCLVPGGWPGFPVPALWPACHSNGRWGCHAQCLSWHSAACRSPRGKVRRGCLPRGASAGTQPQPEALRKKGAVKESEQVSTLPLPTTSQSTGNYVPDKARGTQITCPFTEAAESAICWANSSPGAPNIL